VRLGPVALDKTEIAGEKMGPTNPVCMGRLGELDHLVFALGRRAKSPELGEAHHDIGTLAD